MWAKGLVHIVHHRLPVTNASECRSTNHRPKRKLPNHRPNRKLPNPERSDRTHRQDQSKNFATIVAYSPIRGFATIVAYSPIRGHIPILVPPAHFRGLNATHISATGHVPGHGPSCTAILGSRSKHSDTFDTRTVVPKCSYE